MQIITAGLAPTRAGGTVDDRLFLQQMYNAGLANYQDIVVGIHPYGWGNPPDTTCCDPIPDRGWDDDRRFFFLDTIDDYRTIMVQNGHGNIQMWTTEFGWATWEGFPTEAPQAWMIYNSVIDQANYTMRAFEIAQQRDYMGPMFLWNFNFATEIEIERQNEIAGYSVLVPNFNGGVQERPLYSLMISRP